MLRGQTHHLRFTSDLAATPEQLWAAASDTAGINRELRPWLRMTFPARVSTLGPETVPLGERLCRSWVLLFGVLPIDYDDIVLAAIDPPRGFSERSSMLTCRLWGHDRTLEPLPGGGCRVIDALSFTPRLLVPGALLVRIVGAVFRLRHRNLRRDFGGHQNHRAHLH